ncbi:MAG: hypothetical protein IKZ58_09485 [Selenomonadaceae bacterium]|nr:hypothetical protein [Selenomonadaceae bacterium]
MRYYKEHATEFEMIATGGCYGAMGLDTTKFRYKLFNISRNNQDFYYKYKVAKFIFKQNENGRHLKYALTEISPFIFHFDLSKTTIVNSILEYLITFDDIHNFWLPIEEYRKLFREEFLNTRLPLENIDLNNLFYQKADYPKCMDLNSRINARKRIDILTKNKSYPETVKENVKIFDDYLTLCEENNVRSIIFHPPLHEAFMRYFNREALNEFYTLLGEVLKKHPSAVFFDGWKLKGLSSDEYYSDVDHMNINYAAKFSTILNDFIENLEKG